MQMEKVYSGFKTKNLHDIDVKYKYVLISSHLIVKTMEKRHAKNKEILGRSSKLRGLDDQLYSTVTGS